MLEMQLESESFIHLFFLMNSQSSLNDFSFMFIKLLLPLVSDINDVHKDRQ